MIKLTGLVLIFLCRAEEERLEQVAHYDPRVYAASKRGGKQLCLYLNKFFDKLAKQKEDEESSDASDESFVTNTIHKEDSKGKWVTDATQNSLFSMFS